MCCCLPALDEIFHAAHDRRHVDRYGYIRYRYWRLYGEEALVDERVNVWLVADTLTIVRSGDFDAAEDGDEPVAQYTVRYGKDAPSASGVPVRTRRSPRSQTCAPSRPAAPLRRRRSGICHFWSGARFCAWKRTRTVKPRRSRQQQCSNACSGDTGTARRGGGVGADKLIARAATADPSLDRLIPCI
jgi:hypothetical protein